MISTIASTNVLPIDLQGAKYSQKTMLTMHETTLSLVQEHMNIEKEEEYKCKSSVHDVQTVQTHSQGDNPSTAAEEENTTPNSFWAWHANVYERQHSSSLRTNTPSISACPTPRSSVSVVSTENNTLTHSASLIAGKDDSHQQPNLWYSWHAEVYEIQHGKNKKATIEP